MDRENPTARPLASANDEYRPQLDGLRFLAFLGVFFFHANPGRYAAGSLGVQFFFVLSGFLITRILLRKQGPSLADDLRVFYIRRTLRIFPLYYATLAAVHFVGQPDGGAWSWCYLYNFGCYVGGSFLGKVGHFWTLSVEEQFYLVYPLVLLGTPARLRSRLLWLTFVACALSRHILERFAPSPFTSMLPNVAGEYLIAGAIAGYRDRMDSGATASPIRSYAACLLAAWAALRIGGAPIGPSWTGFFVPDVAAGAFAMLVSEAWRTRGILGRALSLRPLAYLGKISYGCYIFHVFAIHNNSWMIGRLHDVGFPGARSLRTLPALAATIVVSMLSWHGFESRILTLKSRFDYGRGRPRRPPLVADAPTRHQTLQTVRLSGR